MKSHLRIGIALGALLLGIGVISILRFGPVPFSELYLPHRYCYLAQPWLIWTNAPADMTIFLADVVLFESLFLLAWLVLFAWQIRVMEFLLLCFRDCSAHFLQPKDPMAPDWACGSFDRSSKKQGGGLRICSRDGVGTIVSIWLPILANPGGGQTMLAKSKFHVLTGSDGTPSSESATTPHIYIDSVRAARFGSRISLLPAFGIATLFAPGWFLSPSRGVEFCA